MPLRCLRSSTILALPCTSCHRLPSALSSLGISGAFRAPKDSFSCIRSSRSLLQNGWTYTGREFENMGRWKRNLRKEAMTLLVAAATNDAGALSVERQLELAREQQQEALRERRLLQRKRFEESLAELDNEIAVQEMEVTAATSSSFEGQGSISPLRNLSNQPSKPGGDRQSSEQGNRSVTGAKSQAHPYRVSHGGLSPVPRPTEGWGSPHPASSELEAVTKIVTNEKMSEQGGLLGGGALGAAAQVTGPLAHAALRPVILKRDKPLPDSWDTPGGTVVLVDKPRGWTSFAVCGRLRSVVGVKKVGHAGTLDPLATGLLVVCVGRATKLADSFQALYKVYSGSMRLGEGTPSLDADTPVNEVMPWEHISDSDLAAAAEANLGDILQIPPMYSAIKVRGEKMYEKARRGETLELDARPVKIYELTLRRSDQHPQEVDFRMMCSKGTYVRSLCRDIGRQLGSCAHLTALRREQIGELSVEDAWKAEELLEAIQAQSGVEIRRPPAARTGSWRRSAQGSD